MASPSFRFDTKDEAAQAAAQKTAARLVTNISEKTRAALKSLVVRAIREGIPPYDAARTIRSMVGLTEPQAHAAMSYRLSLINSGLTLNRVELLTERYTVKKLRERALTIARTEIMGALNAGALESAKQARREELLGPGATKSTITALNPCGFCQSMATESRPLNRAFSGGHMAPPFHPRCRCSLTINP